MSSNVFNADVLAADNADVLAADTTDVLAVENKEASGDLAVGTWRWGPV